MSKILHLVQGTQEWHEHRRTCRNASETPAVLGLSPWVSPFQLWEIKTGRRVQSSNFAMQRGTDLEPNARAAYEAETGIVMEPLVMADDCYSASLDGISFNGELILEVKCPMKGRESETWQAVAAGKVPEHYYSQVQHQLLVSQASKAHFYVFENEGGTGIWIEVLPDLAAMENIRAAWDEFWQFVESDLPPPLTDMDTVIRQDSEWEEAARSYVSAKESAEEAARAIESAKSRLSSLAKHCSEKGCGVSVSKYYKGNSAKQEIRVTMTKGEVPC